MVGDLVLLDEGGASNKLGSVGQVNIVLQKLDPEERAKNAY